MDAWIKVYHTLSDHPKVYALSDALKIEQFAAVGLVVCLWTWAVIHATDGDLSRFPDTAVARACQWHKTPAALVKALAECGFLDDDRRIHDWDEYAGALIESTQASKEKARQRVAAFRARNADVTRNGGVTQPLQSQPCNADVTRYTSVTKRSCNADVTPRARVEEEEDIDIDNNTHLNIQQGESTRVRAREGAWFDPEHPDTECDTGWLSEKSRPAIAQRIMDWACRRDGFDTTPEEDEHGMVGASLLGMITGAMAFGIHPAEITKALQPLGSIAACERRVAGLIEEHAGINGLKLVSPEWGDRAWDDYKNEMKSAAAQA